ncbi:MAG: hypothetical protein HY235_25065 [Acidobacteria bacterium]|nr:hypothetical protein [Acidobacteriota bacterium]
MKSMQLLAPVLAFGIALAQQPKGPAPPMSAEMRAKAKEYEAKMGRGEGKLNPGDGAPDFRLQRLHSEQQVQLSSFRGKKPVALVFASYT